VALILFLMVAVLLEFVIIYSSISMGLKDTNPLIWKTGLFTISISPLFQLLPICVIIVLFASWIYVTRQTATMPVRKQQAKITRPLPPPRRYEKKRLRTLRRFINRLNKRIDDAGRGVRERISKSRLTKFSEQHPAGRAVFNSAWAIMLPFSILALIVYLIIYPQLIPNAVNWLLGGGSSVLAVFITWTIKASNAVGHTLSPLGWLGAGIEGGLASIAVGFRNGVIGLTTPIVKPMVESSLVGKYVLVQNVAAWASALIALYAGQRGRRRR
jgi:hypothetical protein